MKPNVLFTFLLIFFGISSLHAQRTLLHCGNLIDVKQNRVLTEQTVIVEKNRIVAVERGYTNPQPNDQVVNLRQKFVMPGLIDMHVHLESETSKDGTLKRFTQNPADIAFESVKYAETTLMVGFTSVRDLGGTGVNIALRNAVNKGLVKGPRIFTAGKSIATTGGHADPTNAYRKDLAGDPGPIDGVVNGVEDCRKAVRQRYKDGVDVIKITATGGVLSLAKDGSNPQFVEEEVRAVVEIARDYGLKVAAHAHGAEGMKRAIRGGVASIEHGTYMDDEVIALMKKYGTYYVPTILAGKTVADSAKVPGYYMAIVVPKALAVGPQIQNTFAKAYKAGVKIAFGTDSGVSVHGKNAMEFQFMVEAGMPALEAIRAATLSAADLLGMPEQLGQIEKGFLADIVAVGEDPSKNIKTMMQVQFVMKDGIIYKQP